jgi:hypothetical protein
MDMTSNKPERHSYLSGPSRFRFPWALSVAVLVAMFAVAYSLDNDRSLSERNGVVSQTEADNGVIPSLPPQ